MTTPYGFGKFVRVRFPYREDPPQPGPDTKDVLVVGVDEVETVLDERGAVVFVDGDVVEPDALELLDAVDELVLSLKVGSLALGGRLVVLLHADVVGVVLLEGADDVAGFHGVDQVVDCFGDGHWCAPCGFSA